MLRTRHPTDLQRVLWRYAPPPPPLRVFVRPLCQSPSAGHDSWPCLCLGRTPREVQVAAHFWWDSACPVPARLVWFVSQAWSGYSSLTCPPTRPLTKRGCTVCGAQDPPVHLGTGNGPSPAPSAAPAQNHVKTRSKATPQVVSRELFGDKGLRRRALRRSDSPLAGLPLITKPRFFPNPRQQQGSVLEPQAVVQFGEWEPWATRGSRLPVRIHR